MATLKVKVNGVWEDIPAIQGADGKSAYQSALDGGYVGLEADFNTDLAEVSNKMNLDGSNSLVDTLTFIGSGVLSYDADRQMLQYTNPDGTTNDIGAELWFSEGKASGAIANGACVQFAGVQGDHYLFKTAVPSEINANPSLFMGVATSDIANNAWGKVTHFGVVHGVNTGSYTAGTILWFDSVNGGLTATKPSYPNAQIQVCAVVVSSSTVGSIIVRPTIYQDAYTRSETDDLLDTKAPLLTTTETITVGTGGQFATINAALAYATKKYPTYVSASTRPRITISLLSGFVMAEQVLVDGLNLSWITISSVDAEVSITRSALTTLFGSGYPAFAVLNGGSLPIINTLFNMDTSGTSTSRHGVLVKDAGSRCIVVSSKGVKNAGGHGLYATSSAIAKCNGTNFSGAGAHGIMAEFASTIHASSANASYAGTYGVCATNASTIEFASGNAQRAGYNTSDVLVNSSADGIYAGAGSTINADSVNASYSARYGVYARNNSRINFAGGIATNTGSYSVFAHTNSTIYAGGSNCSTDGNPAEEYRCSYNSFIEIQSATGEVNTTPELNSYTNAGLITNNTGVITTSGSLPLTGGTLTGSLNGTNGLFSGEVRNNKLKFASADIYEYGTDADSSISINYAGYNSGNTRFRNFDIYDGKYNYIAKFQGSDKSTTLYGALNGTTIATSSHIVGQNLKIRGDALEEHKTDGEAQVSINYYGYNSGTTQFRNFAIYDGKGSQVAKFQGSDKSTTLNGALNVGGNVVSSTVSASAVGVVSSGTSFRSYGNSNVQYGIGTNQSGGLDIMANQTGQSVRIWAGTDNTAPTLCGLFLSGNFTAPGNVTAYSDERLKSNITTIENALDKVKALRGVEFDKNDRHEIGVIAQEVQKVIPEVVLESADEMKTLSVAYGNMVGLLIEAIKEQQKQIDELKARLDIYGS